MRKLKWLSIPTILIGLIPICSCNQTTSQIVLDELGNNLTLNNQYIEEFLQNPVDDNVKSDGKTELSKPIPIHLSWKATNTNPDDKYIIKISESDSLINPYVIETDQTSYDLYNCKINTPYYWTVQCGNVVSNVSTFKSKQEKVRTINIDGVTNCRDLGGYSTSDNKTIKQGLIYRTSKYNESNIDELIKLVTPAGEDTMINQLHIKTEVDLRLTQHEAGGLTDKGCIDGINYKQYNMIGDKGLDYIKENTQVIKGIFDNVLSDINQYPLAMHCTYGTDRTGCIAYIVLALCGVDKKDLIADYLLSNYSAGNGPRRFEELKDLHPKTIEDCEGDTLAQKTANCLIKYCDISLETINKVRSILIE